MPKKMTSRIDNLVRSDLAHMSDYSAGPSLSELSRLYQLDPADIIKLDAGENNFGPSPRVPARLAQESGYHAYPDMDYMALRKALGTYAGLGPDHVFVGCGADEILDLILRLVLDPGDKVVNCPPTFGVYHSLIRLNRGLPVVVPRKPPDFRLDMPGILNAIDDRTKAVFVCTPNNPTGNVTPARDVVQLLKTGRLVIVDEAYYEFCGETVAPLVRRYENLVVVRTLSKWAGLAGLRIGYGLSTPPLTEKINRVKMPYNLSVAAQEAALASLEDLKFLRKNLAHIRKERAWLLARLRRLAYLKVHASAGNFLFAQVLGGDAEPMEVYLRGRGIFLRYFDSPLTGKAFRITIGTPSQNRAVAAALAAWIGRRTPRAQKEHD